MCEHSASAPGTGLRVIFDPDEVQREINVAAERCRSDAWTMQPGGHRRWRRLDGTIARDRSMVERGVHMRVLYNHASMFCFAALKYVRELTDCGAEVRTTTELPGRLIIFDRSPAFVAMDRVSGRPPGAIVVTNPTLVAFLRRSYELIWWSSKTADTCESATPRLADDIRAPLIRLMSLGLTDEGVAKRLGMSTRTCRRHIAELLAELQAKSRFQAGLIIGSGHMNDKQD